MLPFKKIPSKENHKPLIRWSVGGCSNRGIEILEESVRTAKILYPDFDYTICYNNLTDYQFNKISQFNIPLVNSHNFVNLLAIEPRGAMWALLPPIRLNPNGYELYMDNDIILTNRMPLIDKWLQNDMIICTRQYKKRAGRPINYGEYEHLISRKIPPLNTGFFGLPPQFQLHLNKIINKVGKVKKNHHNFQGIIAACLTEHPNLVPISKDDIKLCRNTRKNLDKWSGKYGTHFITANNNNPHPCWEIYKSNLKKTILLF